MRTKTLLLAALAVLPATLFVASCSSTSELPPSGVATTSAAYEEGVPGGAIVNTVDVSARVTAMDRTTRKVTLLTPSGEKLKVKVGPEAVNFDQVKVGDMVNARVTQQLLVYLGDADSSTNDGAGGLVALAPKGAQPSGVMAATIQVTGTVMSIDTTHRTATLKFDDGSTQTFPVRDDIDLTQRLLGEKVIFQITEMVALDVTKPE